ncbi:MAG: hypothetical protein AB1553_00380 [Nitrospirota bacterium]
MDENSTKPKHKYSTNKELIKGLIYLAGFRTETSFAKEALGTTIRQFSRVICGDRFGGAMRLAIVREIRKGLRRKKIKGIRVKYEDLWPTQDAAA